MDNCFMCHETKKEQIKNIDDSFIYELTDAMLPHIFGYSCDIDFENRCVDDKELSVCNKCENRMFAYTRGCCVDNCVHSWKIWSEINRDYTESIHELQYHNIYWKILPNELINKIIEFISFSHEIHDFGDHTNCEFCNKYFCEAHSNQTFMRYYCDEYIRTCDKCYNKH